MGTECTAGRLELSGLGRRAVVAEFDGGDISSDGGGLALREVEERFGILARLARCFTDRRDPRRVEHSLETLVRQRVLGICLGYEDLNDHDEVRRDPLLALACGVSDVKGGGRRRESDRGCALAGKSTLNRLELSAPDGARDRYRRVSADTAAMDALLVETFLEAHGAPPPEIVLDLDATDDPLHGGQEGRFFHGHYDSYCYLPLYVFCGEHLLCARLRTADGGDAAGAVGELDRIVSAIRVRWPATRMLVRGDGGFGREEIMAWCEASRVRYVLGMPRNSRLVAMAAPTMYEARVMAEATGETTRRFQELHYAARSWSRERRVVARVEHSTLGPNPRFVVTNVPLAELDAEPLYESLYCARGDMENRIKEQQLDLRADRTSMATLQDNQLRLLLHSFAYVMMQTLRRVGLAGTDMAAAQCGTIRSRLLKVGARVRVSARRVLVSFSGYWPRAALFRRVLRNVQAVPPQSRSPPLRR